MRKSALIFLLIFCPLFFIAQIPNSGFENWTSLGSYENPDGWGTMNNTTTLAGVYTATKGTPGSPGNSYLKLTSKTVLTTVVNGIAVSGRLDSTTMQPISGFPFNQRPANFTGKWQHMIYGTSQGSLSVVLTRWDVAGNNRVTVATVNYTMSGMAMSWANFALPFTYTDGGNPDTCIITLKASGNNPTNNDYLWVDNLGFTGTVVGIKDQSTLTSAVDVFPNPSKDLVNLKFNTSEAQKIKIEISDISGKLVYSENIETLKGESNHQLNVSTLEKGTFLIRIIGEKNSETRKLIIE